jgi:hypothetical protein
MNYIHNLIDSVNMVKGWGISVSGAMFGTALNSDNIGTVVNADPQWFIYCAPILQTLAWVIAIIAGIVTIWKVIRNSEK